MRILSVLPIYQRTPVSQTSWSCSAHLASSAVSMLRWIIRLDLAGALASSTLSTGRMQRKLSASSMDMVMITLSSTWRWQHPGLISYLYVMQISHIYSVNEFGFCISIFLMKLHRNTHAHNELTSKLLKNCMSRYSPNSIWHPGKSLANLSPHVLVATAAPHGRWWMFMIFRCYKRYFGILQTYILFFLVIHKCNVAMISGRTKGHI